MTEFCTIKNSIVIASYYPSVKKRDDISIMFYKYGVNLAIGGPDF